MKFKSKKSENEFEEKSAEESKAKEEESEPDLYHQVKINSVTDKIIDENLLSQTQRLLNRNKNLEEERVEL